MWAVFVNVFTVAAGSVAGLLARNLISKKLSDALMLGIGACTVYIGISGALQGSNTLVLVLSMAIGGAVGTALDLDGKLGGLGGYLDRLVKKSGRLGAAQGDIVQAFVSASLLFCVGSMTIVGSLNAGLSQDYELLYTKSVMDLISSAMLSASLGIGVLCSALFVLVFQGGICMLAGVLAPLLVRDNSIHPNLSSCRLQNSGHHLNRSGLTCTIRSQVPYNLSLSNLHRNVIHRMYHLVILRKPILNTALQSFSALQHLKFL